MYAHVHPHVYGMSTHRCASPTTPSSMHPVHVCTCASSCVWHVYTQVCEPDHALEHAPRACMHMCILMCMACLHTGVRARPRPRACTPCMYAHVHPHVYGMSTHRCASPTT